MPLNFRNDSNNIISLGFAEKRKHQNKWSQHKIDRIKYCWWRKKPKARERGRRKDEKSRQKLLGGRVVFGSGSNDRISAETHKKLISMTIHEPNSDMCFWLFLPSKHLDALISKFFGISLFGILNCIVNWMRHRCSEIGSISRRFQFNNLNVINCEIWIKWSINRVLITKFSNSIFASILMIKLDRKH